MLLILSLSLCRSGLFSMTDNEYFPCRKQEKHTCTKSSDPFGFGFFQPSVEWWHGNYRRKQGEDNSEHPWGRSIVPKITDSWRVPRCLSGSNMSNCVTTQDSNTLTEREPPLTLTAWK